MAVPHQKEGIAMHPLGSDPPSVDSLLFEQSPVYPPHFCLVCGEVLHSFYRGRPRLYCSSSCLRAAKAARRLWLEIRAAEGRPLNFFEFHPLTCAHNPLIAPRWISPRLQLQRAYLLPAGGL